MGHGFLSVLVCGVGPRDGWVCQRFVKSRTESFNITGPNQSCVTGGCGSVARQGRRHHGTAGGKRLEQHDSERLTAQRWGAENVGPCEPRRRFLCRETPEPDNPLRGWVSTLQGFCVRTVRTYPQNCIIGSLGERL